MAKIIFKLPAGVEVPDGKQPGDTFQAMATMKIEPAGSVCLVEIDGEPLPGYKESGDEPNDEAEDDSTQPAQMSLQQRLMSSMGGGAPPQ